MSWCTAALLDEYEYVSRIGTWMPSIEPMLMTRAGSSETTGCDPEVFADEIRTYLRRARDLQVSLAATPTQAPANSAAGAEHAPDRDGAQMLASPALEPTSKACPAAAARGELTPTTVAAGAGDYSGRGPASCTGPCGRSRRR